jgi:hypothetical protein
MKSIHIICLKAFGYDLRYAKKELYKRLSDFLLRITPKYQRRVPIHNNDIADSNYC